MGTDTVNVEHRLYSMYFHHVGPFNRLVVGDNNGFGDFQFHYTLHFEGFFALLGLYPLEAIDV